MFVRVFDVCCSPFLGVVAGFSFSLGHSLTRMQCHNMLLFFTLFHFVAFASIPLADKQEFEEAREIVPELVAKETKFIHFLKVEHYDAYKAAQRIAKYWKGRRILFAERWLLPMNQTGTGTLSMRDIQVLRQGARVMLPRPGKGVVHIIDESRNKQPPGYSLFRVMQYLSGLHYDEHTLREGCTVVHIVNSKPRPEADLNRMMFDLVIQGMQMKLKAYHVVQAYEEGKKEYLDFLGYKASKVSNFRIRTRSNLIAADSFQGTLDLLQSLGFERQQLPRCLGGSYDYSEFANWIRMRISVEDVLSASPIMSNHRLAVVPTTTSSRVDAPNPKHPKAAGTESQQDIRLRNAIRARRSYHRRRLMEFSLQEQQRVWRWRNAALAQQNAFLESLLAQAHHCVAAFSG